VPPQPPPQPPLCWLLAPRLEWLLWWCASWDWLSCSITARTGGRRVRQAGLGVNEREEATRARETGKRERDAPGEPGRLPGAEHGASRNSVALPGGIAAAAAPLSQAKNRGLRPIILSPRCGRSGLARWSPARRTTLEERRNCRCGWRNKRKFIFWALRMMADGLCNGWKSPWHLV
jgi:hypothetical protein